MYQSIQVKKKTNKFCFLLVERLLWFRYAFDDTLPCATKAEVYDLIEM
jgi:hypothetical protein